MVQKTVKMWPYCGISGHADRGEDCPSSVKIPGKLPHHCENYQYKECKICNKIFCPACSDWATCLKVDPSWREAQSLGEKFNLDVHATDEVTGYVHLKCSER